MCPIHINPRVRARELAEESSGLIAPLNSDGINVARSQEAAGIIPIIIPVGIVYLFNGKSVQPDTAPNKTKW